MEAAGCSSNPPHGLILWNVRSKATAGSFLLTGFTVYLISQDSLCVMALHHMCSQRKTVSFELQMGPFKCFITNVVETD